VEGVPLHVWDEDFFQHISILSGRFITRDKSCGEERKKTTESWEKKCKTSETEEWNSVDEEVMNSDDINVKNVCSLESMKTKQNEENSDGKCRE
jgi:hypothetical protein